MRRLAIASLVLGVICLGAVAAHTRLIATSVKVGWNDKGTALSETKTELHELKDPAVLRHAAETFAESSDRMTLVTARYIVYFYAALGALGFVLGAIAYLGRSASNNRGRGP